MNDFQVTDLRDASVDLEDRQRQRREAAPPADALERDSVALFFLIVGVVPLSLYAAAVQSGLLSPPVQL